jgi:hypothetical protein
VKTALALGILGLLASPPADAQHTRAQLTASVTIVEAVGVTVGATTVTQAAGGALDVTTPLSIRGAAPRVVQVVVDGERARPVSEQIRDSCPAQAPTDIPVCGVSARVSVRAHNGSTLLIYLIVTVN